MSKQILRELPVGLRLHSGKHAFLGHDNPWQVYSLMEAVALAARDDHSHVPKTACLTLAQIGNRLNDGLSYEHRQKLIALIPDLVGSYSGPSSEHRRIYAMVDRTIRSIIPHALRQIDPDLADQLARLPAISESHDAHTVTAAIVKIKDGIDSVDQELLLLVVNHALTLLTLTALGARGLAGEAAETCLSIAYIMRAETGKDTVTDEIINTFRHIATL